MNYFIVEFLEKYSGAVTAVATAFIAAFTIILTRVTGRQAKLTRKSIDLARQEFIASHRPRLIVRQFALDQPQQDHAVIIRFSIINIGDSDAILRYMAAEVALWNGKYWEAPGIDPVMQPFSQPPIKNGQRVQMMIESRFKITAAQMKAITENELIICAIGEFTYTDAFKNNRRTGFRRNYDPATDMFAASTNQDQEYQD